MKRIPGNTGRSRSNYGRCFAVIMVTTLALVSMSGCFHDQDTEVRQKLVQLPTHASIEYSADTSPESPSITLSLKGIVPALDEHGRNRNHLQVEETGLSRNVQRFIDVERRRVDVVVDTIETRVNFDFSYPKPRLMIDESLTVPLFLLVDRNWSGKNSYVQELDGVIYDINGTVNGDQLLIFVSSDTVTARIEYTFSQSAWALDSLSKVIVYRDAQEPEQTVVHEIRGVDITSDEFVELPPHSAEALSPLPKYSFSDAISNSSLPMRFPIHTAWNALQRSPITKNAISDSATPNFLMYKESFSAYPPMDSWFILWENENNSVYEAWVERPVLELNGLHVVKNFKERDKVVDTDDIQDWYRFDDLFEIGALHLGMDGGTITALEYLPKGSSNTYFANVLTDILWIEYVSETGPHRVTQCFFDMSGGAPIACTAGDQVGISH